MKPIEPQNLDVMPREVATAMLSEPRARLTNRMRKNCRAARERVFASTSPIVRVTALDRIRNPQVDFQEFGYSERKPASREAKTAKRFRVATIEQLGRWLKRAIARRDIVQRRYLAVPNSLVPKFQARFDAARAALAAIAQSLDTVRDCAEDEIKHRDERAIRIVARRRLPGSSVDFFLHPGL